MKILVDDMLALLGLVPNLGANNLKILLGAFKKLLGLKFVEMYSLFLVYLGIPLRKGSKRSLILLAIDIGGLGILDLELKDRATHSPHNLTQNISFIAQVTGIN
ncbi:hypothetical protein ACJX0J_022507 [Zea mays]